MRRQAQNVQKVKRQFESSKTPQFAEWVHWSGIESMAPWYYYAQEDDIDAVRAQFLESGRHPRVQLKDDTATKSLRYTCTKLDKLSGTVVIHAGPKHLFSLDCNQANIAPS